LRRVELAAAALIAALALVAGWNAYKYPSGAGYDVRQHQEYADLLIHHGQIPGPGTRSEYYTPPGFYALAGVADPSSASTSTRATRTSSGRC
jgi:hypothetical protein